MERDVRRAYSVSMTLTGSLNPQETTKALRIALAALARHDVETLTAGCTFDTAESCDLTIEVVCSLTLAGPLNPQKTAKALRIALAALARHDVTTLDVECTFDTAESCDHTIEVVCDTAGCLRPPGHSGTCGPVPHQPGPAAPADPAAGGGHA
ncbi:hypothetical protein [Longispora albida]|uniref:hypothetical protein n=1 Tax=Longispora albida TaxID=203523 RepID=UPI00037335CD|nr:hypothetical protein [Longispora albida]